MIPLMIKRPRKRPPCVSRSKTTTTTSMSTMNSIKQHSIRHAFDRLEKTSWYGPGTFAESLAWTAIGSSPVSGAYHGMREYVEGVYKPPAERLALWPVPSVPWWNGSAARMIGPPYPDEP